MTKDNKTTLLGGVSYDDEPDFDDVLIFDDKDLYRANLLYQYPVFIPVDMGLGKPVPVESPVFISDSNYSNSNNSFNNTSNVKYVYLPPKTPEQSLDYINKKGNVKDFGYIPPKQDEIVMKPVKKEKNYEDIAKYFYPDMPDKSQIQESKRIPLLTENNEPQVKYYDAFTTLADRNYVAKPIDKSFTGGAAKFDNYDEAKNNEYIESLKELAQIESDKKFLRNLELILSSEKGYSNRKTDKPTNLGVIQDIYDIYRKDRKLPLKDVKNITIEEAVQIYYIYFWKKSGADKLEHPMDYVFFDMYINTNPIKAKRVLNRSKDVYDLIENRRKYYDYIIKVNPKKEEFRDGWNNRLDKLKKYVDDYYKKKN